MALGVVIPSLASWMNMSSVSWTESVRKDNSVPLLKVRGSRVGGNMSLIWLLATLARVDDAIVTSSPEGVLLVLVLVAEPSGTVSTMGTFVALVPFFLCDLDPREWRLLLDFDGIVVS